jgi:transposase
MAKIYHVTLTDDQRTELLEFIRSGQRSVRQINRAHILLLADEGHKDRDIAASLHTSVPTVERTRRRFVMEGLHEALAERPRPGGRLRKKLDEKGLAVLETLARSEPPQGRKCWTMELLADRLVELKVVSTISDETVRKELKKRVSSPG